MAEKTSSRSEADEHVEEMEDPDGVRDTGELSVSDSVVFEREWGESSADAIACGSRRVAAMVTGEANGEG